MDKTSEKRSRLIQLREEILRLQEIGTTEVEIIAILHKKMLSRWYLSYRTRLDYIEALTNQD